MKNLVMIAAIGKNRELGKSNDLIWKFKEDLNFFRKTTHGHHVVMGLKTLESLPRKLENRTYHVISNTPFTPAWEMNVYGDIPSFIDFAKRSKEDIFVMGGASIYTQLLPYSDKLILTEIDATSQADVWFPEFNKKDFNAELIGEYSEDGVNYKRVIYTRKH